MTQHPLALAFALAFATSTALSGCDRTNNLTEQEHIERAKDFESQGDLKTSIIELKNAVQKNPDSAQARLLLGQVYLKTGQGAEAEKELQRAQSLGVSAESIKPLIAEALLQQGEFQRLLSEVSLTGNESAAIKSRILRMFGDGKLGLRQFDEGCSLYSDSLNFDKSHLPAYLGLANCAYAKGKVDEAREHIQAALKINPNDANSLIALGDLERAENNLELAEAAYSSALKQDPENVAGLLKHALLMLSKGQINVAQQNLNNIRKVEPGDPSGYFLQALLHYAADKIDPALEATLKSLKAQPGNVSAYLLLGILQYNKKSYAQAAKTLSAYLQVVPGNADARKVLAAAYLKMGDPEQTLTLLQPLLAVRTDDPQLFAIAAEAYMALKEPGAATSLFEKASDLLPANAILQTQLAISRLASGDRAQAISDLERASRTDSTGNQSSFILALQYLRENQPEKTLQILSDLEKKLPNDPTLHNMKGVAYASKKDIGNARKSFERALAIAPNSFSAAHNLARLDLSQNRPADARKRYETILKLESKNVRAMVALAEFAAKEGNTKEFLSWLDKAIKADPNALGPRQLLARYYIEQNQGDKALALAREANAANPESPAALSLLGKTQLSIGQNENALVSFTRLVQENPASADSHYHLGLAQKRLKRTDAARTSLQKALELQPTYLPVQEALIALEIASNRTDAALRIATAIQAQQPKSPLGASLEGDIHLAAKNHSKAAQAYERASALSPSNTLTVKRHQALTLSGNDKAADAAITQWLATHPDDLFVRAYVSRHYLLTGRTQEAIAAHEWLLKKAPRDEKLLNNLAWLYQKTGDTRALSTAEAAYKLAPESPAIQDTLGWLLVQGGDTKRGLDLLAKARASSDSASVRYHYAVALAKTGDKANARKELEHLLKSDKAFSERAQAESLLGSL